MADAQTARHACFVRASAPSASVAYFTGMRLSPFVLAAAAILAACDTSKPALEKSLAQVQQISAEKDSLLRDVVATSQFIAEVNAEIAKVKASGVSKPVVKTGSDLADTLTPAQARDEVQRKVAALVARVTESEKRLAQSRGRVADLARGNAEMRSQLAAFEVTVAGFRTMVENQKVQIATLTDQVTALETEVTTLKSEKGQLVSEKAALASANTSLATEKAQLTAEQNTVYYVVGTRDVLLKSAVIEMTGGFLGFGKTPVPARDLPQKAFTSIDKLTVKSINLPAPDRTYRIITRQDVSALEAAPEKGTELKGSIKIVDANKFWAASKYLIIVEN